MGTGVWTVLEGSAGMLDFLWGGSTMQNVTNVVIGVIIFLWIMSIIRTAKDISARTGNIFLQILSVLFVTILTPVLGLPLYVAMRPLSYKKDKIPWREATASGLIMCYNCKTFNPKEYNCCIACGEALKTKCKHCHTEYPHDYLFCNKCGAPNDEMEE